MTSLESYLRGEYQQDKQQLRETLGVIGKIVPLFLEFRTEEKGTTTWPYAVKNGKKESIDRVSHSTHSMILFALDAVLQGIAPAPSDPKLKPILFPAKVRLPKDKRIEESQVSELIRTAKAGMVEILAGRVDKEALVESEMYGDDDPLTLTWLAELMHRCQASENDELDQKQLKDVTKEIRKRAIDVCKRTRGGLLKRPGHNELPSTFLALRCLQLAKVAGQLDSKDPKMLELEHLDRDLFEGELHRQLGYFATSDARFDAAALAFAMEGVLQFDAYALSDNTIGHVLETLNLSRQRNPHWRPTTPFIANSQGMVLFPVSVEIMSSIIRSCEILDEQHRSTRFSQVEALLRDYVKWSFARVERIHAGKELVGWHSEHVNQPGTIHLWETSLVLLFLVHYASQLQRKIAADGLRYSGLTIREWKTIGEAPQYWGDEPLTALTTIKDSKYAVLSEIRTKFIDRRLKPSGDAPSSSLLLYGPPGTGKTTVAEQMAFSLKQPLLIITVSDFLAGGAAEVEARAKNIFQVLREQQDVVILFDEIDQFLLDRSSTAYEQQTGIFQFLTPGMLTKFQDLKEAERNIFIVATNYEERIDSAIKRQGRFDERCLLSLPDTERRREFLWQFLFDKLAKLRKQKSPSWKEFQADAEDKPDAKALLGVAEQLAKTPDKGKEEKLEVEKDRLKKKMKETYHDAMQKLAAETALFGYGDLKHLVSRELKIELGATWKTVFKNLNEKTAIVQPAVKLGAYSGRFRSGVEQQYPFEEFAILLYLVGEAAGEDKRRLEGADLSTLQRATGLLVGEETIVKNIFGKAEKEIVLEMVSKIAPS